MSKISASYETFPFQVEITMPSDGEL